MPFQSSKSYIVTLFLCVMVVMINNSGGDRIVYTSRLIHRFSDELSGVSGENRSVPELKSKEYYSRLLIGDLFRQKSKMKMKLGHQHQLLFPSQGPQTISPGNDLGWLHYTWIDLGTPSVSFLVAVDDGSDLTWVPCDCVQCAPLSSENYGSLDLDKNLNEYRPDGSSTSKPLTCSHQLCDLGPKCKSPTQPCPYSVQYLSEDTSSSGQLVEDVLHLLSTGNRSNGAVKASVIFGCGKKQSGGYLNGVAPDGVLGLGLGEVSFPSLLVKSGLIKNSFSLCFNDNGSGRIFFGDEGITTHHWTPFLQLGGKYSTYVVGVDAICVGKSSCLQHTNFHALIDSGTSFTFLPDQVYIEVIQEFDRGVNAARVDLEMTPFEYCYEASGKEPDFPMVKLMLSNNQSFVVQNPIFPVSGNEEILGYCLALQTTGGDIAIFGQNFMTGYHMVFDRENLQLGWSHSDCQDLNNGTVSTAPSGAGESPNSLPTEQNGGGGHAVAPAIAGRAPSKNSAASMLHGSMWMLMSRLLCLLCSFHLFRYTP